MKFVDIKNENCYNCYDEIKGKIYYAKFGGGDGIRSFSDPEIQSVCFRCKFIDVIFNILFLMIFCILPVVCFIWIIILFASVGKR